MDGKSTKAFKPDSGRTSGGGADVNTSRHEDWYDTAQICTNGHVINEQLVSSPHINKKFCDKCGAPTITTCQYCNATIKGAYHTRTTTSSYARKSFCPDCGKPYLWTEAKLKAAKELADELNKLSLEEREMLKKSIDDIIRDTPQTPVAATRVKKLIVKAGKPAAEAFRKLFIDVASETAKKIILEGK
jgi:hypothetical protein